MDRILANLTLTIDSRQNQVTVLGNPAHFTVAMVTTSRSDRYLHIAYGDGHDNIVSLADTESSQLVVTGNGQEMEIVASYGEGCYLKLEFMYNYRSEGVYKPKVEVFEENGGYKNVVEKFDSSDVSLIKGLEDARNENNLIDQGHDSDEIRIKDKRAKITKREARKGSEVLEASYMNSVLVVSELNGLKMSGPRVARCGEEVMFQIHGASLMNTTIQWVVSRVGVSSGHGGEARQVAVDRLIQQCKTSGRTVKDVEAEEKESVTIVESFTSTSTEFHYRYMYAGAYTVTAVLNNPVSESRASASLSVQCPIVGLNFTCPKEVKVGDKVVCHASVKQGTDMTFIWRLDDEKVVFVDGQNKSMSVFKYIFPFSDLYEIGVHAHNNVSKEISEEIVFIMVKEPIKASSVSIVRPPHMLVGNLTMFAIYHPAKSDSGGYYYYTINLEGIVFEFDFGNGRVEMQTRDSYDKNNNPVRFSGIAYAFSKPGLKTVTVYVSNSVSQYSETVEVEVHESLHSLSVVQVGPAVVGRPVRFQVYKNGKVFMFF